ncbi:MAG: BrnA antitoxin family protein [Deltaproteobacteria bacterium]|nr:BrnA antitoxin family protein [Deltaproteobacteria bacterium]
MNGKNKKQENDAQLDAEARALALKPDSELDFSDIPEIEDWDNAVRGKFYRPLKQSISIRVDRDVLAWFKARKGAYQTSINKALREYIITHTQK